MSGLVMLLPQATRDGANSSAGGTVSAACAEDNMQVINRTSPANFFTPCAANYTAIFASR